MGVRDELWGNGQVFFYSREREREGGGKRAEERRLKRGREMVDGKLRGL